MVANVLLLVTITILQCCIAQEQIPKCDADVGGSCEVTCQEGFEMPMPSCSGDKVCCRKSVNLPVEIFHKRVVNSVSTKMRLCKRSRPCRRAQGQCIPGDRICSTLVRDGLCKGTCKCCLKDNCKSRNGKKGCDAKGGVCTLRAIGCSANQTETSGCKKGKKCVCCVGPGPDPRPYCANCGKATIDTTRIIGGQETDIGEYPWQALILLINPGGASQSVCGGSIIKQKWVLTAAHCFSGITYDGMVVSLGDHQTTTADEAASDTILYSDVEYQNFVKIHPDYNSPVANDNDIALIELKNDITFKNNIQPICLGMPEDIVVGSQAVVTGWGNTDYRGDDSEVLMEVALDLISMEECRTKYNNTPIPFDITDNMICTLTPEKDACNGDSGGPLIYQIPDGRWVQIGIVSFGYQCAFNDAPGVYVDVAKYHDWIETTTGSDQC